MTERGLVEEVFAKAVARFLELDETNKRVATRLEEGIQKGLLKDAEWLSNVLRETEGD